MALNLKTILYLLRNSILADYPTALNRFINENPEFRGVLQNPKLSIDARSVFKWHELASAIPSSGYLRDRLLGWEWRNGRYESFHRDCTELRQICQLDIKHDWECDIQDVDGFLESKSKLYEFENTNQMVMKNSPEMIDEISLLKLEKNLAHKEIRIIHQVPSDDYFCRYSWDGRLFLMNSGGSHHFAAAKYIAKRLPKKVSLKGTLYTYSLNENPVDSLRRNFEMFIVSDTPDITVNFHEAMKKSKITWLWCPVPGHGDLLRVIFLPKAERRSTRASIMFKNAGIPDFGEHLSKICASQMK